MLCAFAAIVAAALVGAFGFVVLLGVALLLGMVGLIWSIVALVAFRGGKRDVAVGLTTSLIALFVPVFLVVWLVRNIEWGW